MGCLPRSTDCPARPPPESVDGLICATAAHHGLVVLHDDKDFAAAAGLPADLDEHSVHRPSN
ncbi:hypothetical protein [Streptomyces sp. NPDC055134]